jgi:radical SAM protein with 4Fe4S-binding SPASM domain
MPVYESNPIVLWELARSRDLCGRPCTTAKDRRETPEPTTYDAYKTIDQIASLAPREVIVAGEGALTRDDVGEIIRYARGRGLDPTFVAGITSRLTSRSLSVLKRDGLERLILNVDGSTPAIHRRVSGVAGTFEYTLRTLTRARQAGVAVEINTEITRSNAGQLTAIADLIRPAGIIRWNLCFAIPKASAWSEMVSALEAEGLFSIIDEIRRRESFAVRVVEAPHYRRYRLERGLGTLPADEPGPRVAEGPDPAGLRELMESALDGARGFVFISHTGDVRPSEFITLSAGNLHDRPLGAIYCSSDLFIALRDPHNLKGRCGRCEFRFLCGGSRARAFAIKGNIFADDPLCAYQPGGAGRLTTTQQEPMESFV